LFFHPAYTLRARDESVFFEQENLRGFFAFFSFKKNTFLRVFSMRGENGIFGDNSLVLSYLWRIFGLRDLMLFCTRNTVSKGRFARF